MSIITRNDNIKNAIITINNNTPTDHSEISNKLMTIAEKLNGVLNLSSFVLKQKPNPLKYDYDLVLKDSRLWSQVIDFSPNINEDPRSNFQVPNPGFRMSEVAQILNLTTQVISMLVHEGVNEITITWS